VMSDVFGVSGLAILKALVAGETSPERLAELAKGLLRKKRTDLIRALEGKVEEHHRFLMGVQLRRLEAADHDIAALDERIIERLKPYGRPVRSRCGDRNGSWRSHCLRAGTLPAQRPRSRSAARC